MSKKTTLNEREVAKPRAKAPSSLSLIGAFVDKDVSSTDSYIGTDNKTNFVTNNDTKKDSVNVKTKVTKKVISKDVQDKIDKLKATSSASQTRSIKIGSTTIKVNATVEDMENAKRSAYHLREDTLEKIYVCSKLAGLKKAELVDFALNHFLSNIINNLEN